MKMFIQTKYPHDYANQWIRGENYSNMCRYEEVQ